jgi:3-polyprenyl-4-hydroxybenzoate decarboxylase
MKGRGPHEAPYVIVVDEDIDIDDDGRVLWAVMTRTQADRSFFMVPGSYISRVDPTGYPAWHSADTGNRLLSTRLGIDATKPLDSEFPEVAAPPKTMWAGLEPKEWLG